MCHSIWDNAIQTRLNVLDALLKRVQGDTHLTAAQQTTLSSQITQRQQGLTALKTKLDAETNVAAARADVHNIYAQFYIFALFIPLVHHEIWADQMLNADAMLTADIPTIQQAITDAQKLGKNVTVAQNKLKELQTDLTDAATHLTTFNNLVPQVTVTNLQGSETILRSMNKELAAAHNDVHNIKAAVEAILAAL
jgi:predicted  nucleic acid-binding Zn-ribbon protein